MKRVSFILLSRHSGCQVPCTYMRYQKSSVRNLVWNTILLLLKILIYIYTYMDLYVNTMVNPESSHVKIGWISVISGMECDITEGKSDITTCEWYHRREIWYHHMCVISQKGDLISPHVSDITEGKSDITTCEWYHRR